LGVKENNEGTIRLRRANGKAPWFRRAQRLAWAKARDPVRIEKIAAAKRGKPRPPAVHAALRRANVGRKLTLEHRQKQSAAHKRRGTRPPWIGKPWAWWEDRLVSDYPLALVAERTGRALSAVASRRRVLRMIGK
jgi:NUMOD3 motif